MIRFGLAGFVSLFGLAGVVHCLVWSVCSVVWFGWCGSLFDLTDVVYGLVTAVVQGGFNQCDLWFCLDGVDHDSSTNVIHDLVWPVVI
jgi:hypothetical protein